MTLSRRLAVLVALAVGFAVADPAQLVITNNSKYSLYSIQYAPHSLDNWEANVLRDRGALKNGEFIRLRMSSGYYDFKIVDQDREFCIIRNYHVAGEMKWSLTTEYLQECERNSRRR